MRDPADNLHRYEEFFRVDQYLDDAGKDNFSTLELGSQVHRMASLFDRAREYIPHQYGRGDSFDVIKPAIASKIDVLIDAAEFVRKHAEQANSLLPTACPISGIWRLDFQFSGLVLLLHEELGLFRQLLSPLARQRGYLFDLLIKSFIPDYVLMKKYTVDKYSVDWTNPVVAALAQPPEKRPAALAAHMKNWNRLMRRYIWPGQKYLTGDFAFEVALAVCAYDIDDSSFNDHPYYPRDLVQYYRTHLRDTRDAWRAKGVGAGVDIIPPPPPKKADLAKSKRKNLARWIELVCDGDNDATESVLETVGKLRKVKDLWELMCALDENNHAIHADIKDDHTLTIAVSELAFARGMGEFEGPEGPPYGPARCSATLLAFTDWVPAHGYSLVDLDDQDDAWHAVLVKTAYLPELLSLSQTLGLVTREPHVVYTENT